MTMTLAIEQQRAALLRVVLGLFVTMGVEPGGSINVVPKHVRLSVLGILVTAETALNWLIVAAALNGPVPQSRVVGRSGGRFVRLLDFWRLFLSMPRSLCGWREAGFQPDAAPCPDEDMSAEQICARLNAFLDRLNTIPKQARLLARAKVQLEPARFRSGIIRARRSAWASQSMVKRTVARKLVRADRSSPTVLSIDSS